MTSINLKHPVVSLSLLFPIVIKTASPDCTCLLCILLDMLLFGPCNCHYILNKVIHELSQLFRVIAGDLQKLTAFLVLHVQ